MKYVDLTKEQRECLHLGETVVEMIRTLGAVSGGDEGYARRSFSFNQGSVIVFLVKSERQASIMEAAVRNRYAVGDRKIEPEPGRPQ